MVGLIIFLNLDDMLLQFSPVRSGSFILGQHKFKKIGQLRRVRLLKSIHVVL